MTCMTPDDSRQNLEPSEDVISKRDAILAVAAATSRLSEKSLSGWAFAKFRMPSDLIPLVRAFAAGKIEAIEVINEWRELDEASDS